MSARTTAKSPIPTLRDDGLDSTAQRERRKRIIDGALALASMGGYEAVQMRAVAERADVALGTLYRYFPSKIHLLVAALAREFQRAHDKMDRSAIAGDTPKQRLLEVLARNTRTLQRDPLLTEAMVRAFMFADATVAGEVQFVGRLVEDLFAKAMGCTEPSTHDRAIFQVIKDVWMANLVAWVTRRATAADVEHRLELSIDLLLEG